MTTIESTDIPRLRPGLDLTTAGLSNDEGLVACRIDGQTAVKDLCHLVSQPAMETHRILDRLTRAGVVIWTNVQDKGPRPETIDLETPDYGDFIFPVALITEPGDLSEADRKRIIWFHANLDHWNHYELLRASRLADGAALKKAYFARSKEWHPDRFRIDSELGSFKLLIEQVYDRIRTAHQVLSNPETRQRYDRESVLMVADEDISEMLDTQRRQDREKRREQEAIERRKKKNPMKAIIRKAKGLIADAEKERAGGDVIKALGLAQLAQAYDPRPEYEKIVNQLKEETAETRVAPLLRRARQHEEMTRWSEAVRVLETGVEIAPRHAIVRMRLAYNMVKGGRDPKVARSHAQRAVQLLPNEPEAHFVLGLCYQQAGKGEAAKRSLEKALELKPNYKDAKKALRELRWGF